MAEINAKNREHAGSPIPGLACDASRGFAKAILHADKSESFRTWLSLEAHGARSQASIRGMAIGASGFFCDDRGLS
jgi:hypothetical protein